MNIFIETRPKEGTLLTEVRAASSAYGYRRRYLKLHPEVDSQNIVISKYGRKHYPVYQVWEMYGNGH